MSKLSDELICDRELNEKPTLEEIFIIRLRAVAQAQLDKTIKDGDCRHVNN